MVSRREPSFTGALVMSFVPLVVIGALAGRQLRSKPDAVVATTLFIVAIIDLLGLVRYIVYGAEHREQTRIKQIYEARCDDQRLDTAVRSDAERCLLKLETSSVEFDGLWMLLPQFAVSSFAIAMALAAHTGMYQ
jgi:hypothetical protein